jgi:gas vesicle protein
MQYSQVVKTSNSQADLNSLNESIKGLYSGMKELAISISTNVKNQLSDFERCHESKVNKMMNDIVKRQEIIIKNEFEEAKKELKNNIAHKLEEINNQFHEYKKRLIFYSIRSNKNYESSRLNNVRTVE